MFEASTEKEVRFVQPLNAPAPILVTELGIVMEVRLVQVANALMLIKVNEAFVGNVTEVRAVQFRNACEPILVTEFGIVIEGRLVQSRNACADRCD